MLQTILVYGLAMGAIYTLVAVAYNVMFSASRVMSFTAGQLGMLGGVLGSLFIMRLGLPTLLGTVAALGGCAVVGVLTELVAVRPVLGSLEKHLYVLTTLAFALMIQQFTAIEWSTEPQPFPHLFGGGVDARLWLPMVACVVAIVLLELLMRRTLLGHAFIAIAEDTFAARALGLPERRLRMTSFAIAGVMGGLAGFAGGELMKAFFGNGPDLTLYGFIPVALGGIGNNRGAIVAGIGTGIFQQAVDSLGGGLAGEVATFGAFITLLLIMPEGVFGASRARRV